MFFIDYGNTEMLRGDQLVPVDARIKTVYRRLVSVPAAAIECSLAETRPNPARNTRGIWDSEVLGIFKEFVLNKVRGGTLVLKKVRGGTLVRNRYLSRSYF